MAGGSVEIPSNPDSSVSSYITEDMFDAAMSERLSMEGDDDDENVDDFDSESGSEKDSDDAFDLDFDEKTAEDPCAEPTKVCDSDSSTKKMGDLRCNETLNDESGSDNTNEDISFYPKVKVVETDTLLTVGGELNISQVNNSMENSNRSNKEIEESKLPKAISFSSGNCSLVNTENGMTVMTFGAANDVTSNLEGSVKNAGDENIKTEKCGPLSQNHLQSVVEQSSNAGKSHLTIFEDGNKTLVLASPKFRTSDAFKGGKDVNGRVTINLSSSQNVKVKEIGESANVANILVNKAASVGQSNVKRPINVSILKNNFIPENFYINSDIKMEPLRRLMNNPKKVHANNDAEGSATGASKISKEAADEAHGEPSGSVANKNVKNVKENKPTQAPVMRKLLPKINFRYHQTGSVPVPILAEKRTKGNNYVTLVRKGNDFCVVTDKNSLMPNKQMLLKPISQISAKCILPKNVIKINTPSPLDASDKTKVQTVSLITSPSVSNTSISPKSMKQHAQTVASVPVSVSTSSISANSLTPQTRSIVTVQCPRAANTTSPKSTPSNVSSQESTSAITRASTQLDKEWDNMHREQLRKRELPQFSPAEAPEYFTCFDCDDRFTQDSSLKYHRFRRSVLIQYWCKICNCLLNFYNRCIFLGHIRSHNQFLKNIDFSCISVEPIPRTMIKFGLDESPEEEFEQSSQVQPTAAEPGGDSPTATAPTAIGSGCDNNSSSSSSGSGAVGDVVSNSNNLVAASSSLSNNESVELEMPADGSETVQSPSNLVERSEIECVVAAKDSLPVSTSIENHISEEPMEITQDDFSQDIEEEDVYPDHPEDPGDLGNDFTALPETAEVDLPPRPTSAAEVDADVGTIETDKNDDIAVIKANAKGKRCCPECGMVLSFRVSLRKHIILHNKPGPKNLKCNVCQLILPTRCALRMHLRIHMKLKPYRCPECAIEFHIYDRYMMHLKYTCCHMSKVVRYSCSLCSFMHASSAGLEQHLIAKHVRSIFKCGRCPVAFLNTKMIDRHKEKVHANMNVVTNAYEQCRLCPDKLIPQRKFSIHIQNHCNDDKFCVYAYECPKCTTCFFQKTELIYHRMKCDTRQGIIQSLISSPPRSPAASIEEIDLCEYGEGVNISAINTSYVDDEATAMPTKKKQKFSNDDDIQVLEKDPLSLEGFEAEEETPKEPRVELCLICKKQRVIIEPGQNPYSQSLCCSSCVRPCNEADLLPKKSFITTRKKTITPTLYKCNICNSRTFVNFNSCFEHFKKAHKNMPGSASDFIAIEQKNVFHSHKRSNTYKAAETIKEKYIKRKKAAAESLNFKEEPVSEDESGSNQPDSAVDKRNGTAKRRVKGKQKPAASDGMFESGQLILPESIQQSNLNCSKCDFIASDISELHEHVTCHRTDPNALQCLECGECFVVRPSFEKHLIMNHMITDVDVYIAQNKQCLQLESDDDKGEGGNMTCSVCLAMFDSKMSLDKHFRTHGMAFLFKTKL